MTTIRIRTSQPALRAAVYRLLAAGMAAGLSVEDILSRIEHTTNAAGETPFAAFVASMRAAGTPTAAQLGRSLSSVFGNSVSTMERALLALMRDQEDQHLTLVPLLRELHSSLLVTVGSDEL